MVREQGYIAICTHIYIHIATLLELLILLQPYIATSIAHMPLMVQASTPYPHTKKKGAFIKQYFWVIICSRVLERLENIQLGCKHIRLVEQLAISTCSLFEIPTVSSLLFSY